MDMAFIFIGLLAKGGSSKHCLLFYTVEDLEGRGQIEWEGAEQGPL